jgi:uncharacterized protein YkwD
MLSSARGTNAKRRDDNLVRRVPPLLIPILLAACSGTATGAITAGEMVKKAAPADAAVAVSTSTTVAPAVTTTSESTEIYERLGVLDRQAIAPPPTGPTRPETPPASQPAPKPAPTTTTTPPAPPAPAGGFSGSMESQFGADINGLRQSVGLAGLARNGDLDGYARWWAKQLAETGALSHSDIGSLLGPWNTVGENVAYGVSTGSIFSALVGSPGHYANMVGAGFTAYGIGVYVDGAGRLWTCHVFAG